MFSLYALGVEDYSTRTMAAGSISSQTRWPISNTALGAVETRETEIKVENILIGDAGAIRRGVKCKARVASGTTGAIYDRRAPYARDALRKQ